MGYIIIWRSNHREPFVDVDTHDFKEVYSSFDDAKQAANTIQENENQSTRSAWYFDYEIFEHVTS